MSEQTIPSRGVAATWSSLMRPGMGNGHRVRPLVADGDYARSDPFLFLMEDWFGPHVFEDHPHRGIETVTYVIEGTLEHREHGRNTGTFSTGDAMWMTAGRGVIHNEAPAGRKEVHTLQLWVNLPASEKMTVPRFQILKGDTAPERAVEKGRVRVFSGQSGEVRSDTLNHVPVTMVEFRLEPGGFAVQELPASYNGFLHVLEGDGFFGKDRATAGAGEIVWMEMPGGEGISQFAVTGGSQGLRALLWAGEPLREPVVARGPFVMNTEQQIREAYDDFRAGRFG
jgi:redox-sensitive bicupin YhaK (pirin superfamily)